MSMHPTYSARAADPAAIEPVDIAAWEALEASAEEPNAYLSPNFILPASRWLTPNEELQLVIVERHEGRSTRMVGLGAFGNALATRHRVSTLRGYRSKHSFLGGLLLDRGCSRAAFHAMLAHLAIAQPNHHLIELPQVWSEGTLCRTSTDGSHRTRLVRLAGSTPRAILVPAESRSLLRHKQLANRLRDHDRRMRRLREFGRVDWRALRGTEVDEMVVERFLALEHMGWKGEQGSSLRSNANEEAFFRAAVKGFAASGRVVFTELSLDGVAISSTCTFIAGGVGFAFKIGWDPAFRAQSPAMLNEIEFVRHAEPHFGDLRYIDSGSEPGSYINDLWLSQRSLTTLRLSTGFVGAQYLRLGDWWATLKQGMHRGTPALAVLAMS